MITEIEIKKKNGKKKKVEVNGSNNQFYQFMMQKVISKGNCIDIFKQKTIENDGNQDKCSIPQSQKKFLKYKVATKSRQIVLHRIQMFIGLGLMQKELYLKGILKRIDLQKDIFIEEIEQGKESSLMKDLS